MVGFSLAVDFPDAIKLTHSIMSKISQYITKMKHNKVFTTHIIFGEISILES